MSRTGRSVQKFWFQPRWDDRQLSKAFRKNQTSQNLSTGKVVWVESQTLHKNPIKLVKTWNDNYFTNFEDSERKKELPIASFITNLFFMWEIYSSCVDVTSRGEYEWIGTYFTNPDLPYFLAILGGRRCQEKNPHRVDLRRVFHQKKSRKCPGFNQTSKKHKKKNTPKKNSS